MRQRDAIFAPQANLSLFVQPTTPRSADTSRANTYSAILFFCTFFIIAPCAGNTTPYSTKYHSFSSLDPGVYKGSFSLHSLHSLRRITNKPPVPTNFSPRRRFSAAFLPMSAARPCWAQRTAPACFLGYTVPFARPKLLWGRNSKKAGRLFLRPASIRPLVQSVDLPLFIKIHL